MASMFGFCPAITTLNLTGFDTSAVTNMGSMFSGCSGLTALDVTGFDTLLVTNMNSMFMNCSKLTVLDLTRFRVDAVTGNATSTGGFNFLSGVKLTKPTYDALLAAWATQAVQPAVAFHFGTSQYSRGPSAAATARDTLTNAPNNWTITDGGPI